MGRIAEDFDLTGTAVGAPGVDWERSHTEKWIPRRGCRTFFLLAKLKPGC